MKKRNSARNHLFTALLIGGIFMTGAAASAHAQSDGGGTIGSGTNRDGGYLGSGNRDGGGGTIGSGARTEDDGGGTIGSGTLASADGGMLGSGTRSDDGGHLGSGVGAGFSFASVWEFF